MSRGIKREHSATPHQRSLVLGKNRGGKATQADVLLAKLREARNDGRALGLPEIMAAGIAQHGARFNELRSQGFVIENEMDRDNRGVVRSRYWLRVDPQEAGADAK